jgi:hypothetical protein
MKNTSPTIKIFLILPFLWVAAFPRSGWTAEDATDAIEKELHSVLREMDTLSSELDRISEIASVPKSTSLRIEIGGIGEIAPPLSAKLLLSGKTEAEREFTKQERDAFHLPSGVIVWNVPMLPGQHDARIVLSHPYANQSPSFEFRPTLKPGEAFRLRLTLKFAKEKSGAVLTASPEK